MSNYSYHALKVGGGEIVPVLAFSLSGSNKYVYILNF
jgi:hypothetical protein